jgi:tRNA-dihydrouridine synthase B
MIDRLYEEMLCHHGRTSGVRHARKHLGWALDVAAETAGASDALLKAHRHQVLTADDPAVVRRQLAGAYAAFAAVPFSEPTQPAACKTGEGRYGGARKAA